MKLVDDWKDAWRWWSIRGLMLLASLPVIWVALPADIKAMVPPEWKPWLLTAIAIGTAVGRLKDQKR